MKNHHLFLLFCLCSPLSVTESRAQQAMLPIDNDSTIIVGSPEYIEQSRQKRGIVNNALEVLSGQSAGVNVTTNGLDRMAMLNSIRVRGTASIMGGNDPLVILDGVTTDISTLQSVYPADIESFRVLKDAAETAQYGSRGASGVIEVTTKKGTGQGFQISYEGNYGVQSMYRHLNMLSGPEYVATAQALGVFAYNGGYNTDFYDEITRVGVVHNHYLAFSGGGDKSNYRASFGYVGNNTIIDGMRYNNLIAKIDVTQKAFGDRLVGDFGVFGSIYKNYDIFDSQTLFYATATQNPTLPYNPGEGGTINKNEGAYRINPPKYLLEESSDQKDINFNTHLKLTYEIIKNLKLSLFGSYSFTSTENAEFCPTKVWAQGNVYRGENKKETWIGSATLTYAHTWGDHSLNATASTEYQSSRGTFFGARAKGISTNDFGYDNIGATSSRPYGGTESTFAEDKLASVMGSLSYNLRSRYTFTLTARTDGSSLVGDNHTWGFFPSVSGEWDIKKENFLKDVRPISLLKLRMGWGLSGNLGGISAYTTMNTVRQTGIVSIGGTPVVTLGQVKNNNPDLKWEKKSTYNVGMDIGLLDNRLMLTASYYYSRTNDLLYAYDVPVPPFKFDKLLANIGSMSNKGVELGFSLTPVMKKDMELNIGLNVAFQKNKLISLSGEYNGMQMTAANITAIAGVDGAGQNGGDNNVVYQIVGQPLGVFYLPHCTGLKQGEDGYYTYDIADLNGDGVIDLSDGGDRYIAGQATPKTTLGANINFRYKDFYIALQVNGAFGHKIFNGTSLAYNNLTSFPSYNVLKEAPSKRIADQQVSDYYLERGDYVSFDCLTLGWNAPIKSRLIRSLRLSLSVNNLGTISAYSGLTPKINSYVLNSTFGVDDKRSYPLYRVYSLGVSVQF